MAKFFQNTLTVVLAACPIFIAAVGMVDTAWGFTVVCVISGVIAGRFGTSYYWLIALVANFPIAAIIVFGVMLGWENGNAINVERDLTALVVIIVPPVVAEIVGRRSGSVSGKSDAL